jgi:hypothetical protein
MVLDKLKLVLLFLFGTIGYLLFFTIVVGAVVGFFQLLKWILN